MEIGNKSKMVLPKKTGLRDNQPTLNNLKGADTRARVKFGNVTTITVDEYEELKKLKNEVTEELGKIREERNSQCGQ